MFEFLTTSKDTIDPLASPKSVSAWLRQLPALDVIGRQQHVMRAFDGMRLSRKPVDPARVLALQFLDSALGADRRQLIKQYVENAETSGSVVSLPGEVRNSNIDQGAASPRSRSPPPANLMRSRVPCSCWANFDL